LGILKIVLLIPTLAGQYKAGPFDVNLTHSATEHRRQWIEDRLLELTDAFAIDIVAYAVMSNHYHVVLHINREMAQQWSNTEVIEHWHSLFKGSLLSQRYVGGETLSRAERDALQNR
jgi:hypothetical protein